VSGNAAKLKRAALTVSYRKHLSGRCVSYVERMFREVIGEWFTRTLPRYVPREVEYVLGDFTLAVVGPRRAGKTYFLFQIADELVKGGAPRESVVYVNFEDVKLAE